MDERNTDLDTKCIMQPNQIRTLLEQVRSGTVEVKTAEDQLIESMRRSPFENLGFARVDHHRAIRQGFPEVIFGEGKSPSQITEIATKIIDAGHNLLITRTNRETFETVRKRIDNLVFHETARIISHNIDEHSRKLGNLLVISAGTADQILAEEAVVTAEVMGNRVTRLYDVGVAGLHRLLAQHSTLQQARVIIVVAGMEGALASVVGGLVSAPVIAVPTSVGYGTGFGGIAALLSMLNSCANGVTVVNIDNGFGAGAFASIVNQMDSPSEA